MVSGKVLGSAVLVYAALTSGAVLSVAQGWSGAANTAHWLAYLVGGIGLIRGRRWGRTLTLIAAGASIVDLVAGLIFIGIASLSAGSVEPARFSALAILAGLPAIALFVLALRVQSPAAPDPSPPPGAAAARKPRLRRRTLQDIAYVAFGMLGLIALWTAYFVQAEIRAGGGSTGGVDGVLGFLVLIPFGIPMLAAMVLGPGLTVYLRHDWRLTALTLLMAAALIALGNLRYPAWPVVLLLYAAPALAIGATWFGRYRAFSA